MYPVVVRDYNYGAPAVAGDQDDTPCIVVINLDAIALMVEDSVFDQRFARISFGSRENVLVRRDEWETVLSRSGSRLWDAWVMMVEMAQTKALASADAE